MKSWILNVNENKITLIYNADMFILKMTFYFTQYTFLNYSELHIMHIASAKIPERKGIIPPFCFFGQLPNYWSHVYRLACPVDQFSQGNENTV